MTAFGLELLSNLHLQAYLMGQARTIQWNMYDTEPRTTFCRFTQIYAPLAFLDRGTFMASSLESLRAFLEYSSACLLSSWAVR